MKQCRLDFAARNRRHARYVAPSVDGIACMKAGLRIRLPAEAVYAKHCRAMTMRNDNAQESLGQKRGPVQRLKKEAAVA